MYLDQYEDNWNRRLTAILRKRLQDADSKQRLQLVRDIHEMKDLHHISRRQAKELLDLAETERRVQPAAPADHTAARAKDDANRRYKQLLLF